MTSIARLRRHIFFLDVGHGNSTVLAAGDQDIIVIDVGKQSALSAFLKELQITQIKSVYLSHADEDHIGGLIGLLGSKQISIDRVFLNSDASKKSKIWDDLLYELDAAHRGQQLVFTPCLVSGQTEQLSGSICVEVLGPSRYLVSKGPGSVDRQGRKIRSNSISAVVAISSGGERLAILPGDLDAVGLRDLLRNEAELNAPILVYPHHGGLAGTRNPSRFVDELLNAVAPNQIIFSIGRGHHGTPNPDIVKIIRDKIPDIRIVCTQLSEHCSQGLPKDLTNSHLTPLFAQGKFRGACCGGTIAVELDKPFKFQPEFEAHTRFIRTHAPTPMCQ